MKKDHILNLLFNGVLFVLIVFFFNVTYVFSSVTITFDVNSPQQRFAVDKFEETLQKLNSTVSSYDIHNGSHNGSDIIVLSNDSDVTAISEIRGKIAINPAIEKEGFQILKFKNEGSSKTQIVIMARDDTGAMYGILDVAEQIYMTKNPSDVQEKMSNPRFPFRAIKFNLPWSPYRPGAAADIHVATCRDLDYWRRFLDMMAENRFNVLSLWNLHPFTFMIRPEHYPEACPFNAEEMRQWKTFWTSLFRMAKERGIETYLVNWNIVVSPEFAKAHGVKEKNDTSKVVREYSRECVTQVINEYEDLTGLGVTLADWMEDMTPKEREDWIEQTFVAGMKNARRQLKFIHRSVLAGSPVEMRRVIDNAGLPDPVWVEVKFNWSHGHSTPRLAITHDYSTGELDKRFWDPMPVNYKIVWMIRNEDFFILRWGDPDFIRKHIAVNGKEYVGGYFVGSEGYIPAKDYSHQRNAHQTWNYAFEKQWFFYALWGRLLYDPETPDSSFESMFKRRYGEDTGQNLLQAYSLASRMPLRLASFYAATWDFTLYSEGFLAPRESRGLNDKVSSFISVDELIQHQTLDPTYVSIPEYVKVLTENRQIPQNSVTPLSLANDLDRDGKEALKRISLLRPKVTQFSGALECEIDDLETWAYLSLYFAEKLRGGTALEIFRENGEQSEKSKAIEYLQSAAEYWKKIVAVTRQHYMETPYVSGETFSWGKYYDQVMRDIQIAKEAEKH